MGRHLLQLRELTHSLTLQLDCASLEIATAALSQKDSFFISVMNDMTKLILWTSVLTKHQFYVCFYAHTVQAKTPSK